MLVMLSALGRHRSLTAKAEEKMSIVSTRSTNATDAEAVDRFMLDELSSGKAPPRRRQTKGADSACRCWRGRRGHKCRWRAGRHHGTERMHDDPFGRQVRKVFGALCLTGHALRRDCPHMLEVALQESRARGWTRREFERPGNQNGSALLISMCGTGSRKSALGFVR